MCILSKVLYMPYISRGFYFREFRESGATLKINNAQKNIYLRSRHMNAQLAYTVHVQGTWYY